MQEGMEGNPVAGIVKNVYFVLSVLPVPITSTFPKVELECVFEIAMCMGK
ncbi:hypothetical protein SLEP1_g56400 [Rubroshorea leprosula]|uniref:Uncharacterized protein n=1 Tax=Rubroshorea leprosula TaxID=152421 RepID=A0AAV5MLJ0_9ROSI|nr:hypothetical protein SLEP1_g56400 [Rubroshorea leprosula]